MQSETVLKHIREEAEKIKGFLLQLESDPHLTADEASNFLSHIERIYRGLAAYTYMVKNQEMGSDLQVHMKIMQTVAGIENNVAAELVNETPPPEQKEEKAVDRDLGEVALRKIELSINNKFRISNELFNQSQLEFNAALQQLNSMNTQEEAMRYLDSLKQIYKWKDENPLVKNFYALVQKRFS